MQTLLEFIYHYQTLIAGIMAVVIGFATVGFLCHQIRQTDKHYKHTRHKKFLATRAVLPLAMHELCDYARETRDFALRGREAFIKGSEYIKEEPRFPGHIIEVCHIIEVLRDIITHSDCDALDAAISKLIVLIQIHRTRLKALPRQNRETHPDGIITECEGSHEYEYSVFDAIQLYVYSKKFFNYARRKTEEIPEAPSSADVFSSYMGYHIPWKDFKNSVYRDSYRLTLAALGLGYFRRLFLVFPPLVFPAWAAPRRRRSRAF